MEAHEQAHKLLPLTQWTCTEVLHWMVDIIGTEAWDLNAIRENEIDGRCLIQLTNEDLLESLRINSGIRRTRVLRAIEQLSAEADAMRSTGAVFHEYQAFRPNIAPTALQSSNATGAVSGIGATVRITSAAAAAGSAAADAFVNDRLLPRRTATADFARDVDGGYDSNLRRPSSAPKSLNDTSNVSHNNSNHATVNQMGHTDDENVPDMWVHFAREAVRTRAPMQSQKQVRSADVNVAQVPPISPALVPAATTNNSGWDSLPDNTTLAAERQRQWEAFDNGHTSLNGKAINNSQDVKGTRLTSNGVSDPGHAETGTMHSVSGINTHNTPQLASPFPTMWPPPPPTPPPPSSSRNQSHTPMPDLSLSSTPTLRAQQPPVTVTRTSGRTASVQLQGGQNVLVRCIRYSELCVDPSSVIGSGSYGTVYKAVYHGARCVFKQLHNQQLDEAELLREAAVMQSVSAHPHITHFFGVTTEGPRGFVHEALHASLEEWLLRSKGNHEEPLSEILRFASEAASGILHLHCEAVVVSLCSIYSEYISQSIPDPIVVIRCLLLRYPVERVMFMTCAVLVP
jgi:hypothetical protein